MNTTLRKVLSGFSALAVMAGCIVATHSVVNNSAVEVQAAVAVGNGSSSGGGGGGNNQGGWRDFGANGIFHVDLSNYPQWGDAYSFMHAVGGQQLVEACTVANTNTYVYTGNFGGDRWPWMLHGTAAGTNNVHVLGQYASYATATVVVICVNNPDQPTGVTGTDYRVTVEQRPTQTVSETGYYSLATNVSPALNTVGVSDDGTTKIIDPIGVDNLHMQSSGFVKTSLGELWDALQNDADYSSSTQATSTNLAAKYGGLLAQAVENDKNNMRPVVNLDETNQQGMAEGGILNVAEFGLPLTVSVATDATVYQLQKRNWVEYSLSGKHYDAWSNASEVSNGSWVDTVSPVLWDSRGGVTAGRWESYRSSTVNSLRSQQQIGFWQILSVNCNITELNELLEARRDLVIMSQLPAVGDASGSYNVTLRTPMTQQMPTVNALGSSASNNHVAVARTSDVGFFDKECPFNCTPSRDVNMGASEANGAINNVNSDNHDASSTGQYGMNTLKDNVNNSSLELFRDFAGNDIEPDVWYPVSENGISYDGGEAKSTIVSRAASGSPNLQSMSGASNLEEVFKVSAFDEAGNETRLFTTSVVGSYNAHNNQSEVPQPYSSTSLGRVGGTVHRLNVAGAWSSSDGLPQVLNVKWEYNPVLTKSVPVTSIGMNNHRDGGVRFDVGEVSTPVDGICVGEFGTTTNSDDNKIISTVNANTGSDTNTRWTVNFTGDPRDDSESIVVKFIRSVGE